MTEAQKGLEAAMAVAKDMLLPDLKDEDAMKSFLQSEARVKEHIQLDEKSKAAHVEFYNKHWPTYENVRFELSAISIELLRAWQIMASLSDLVDADVNLLHPLCSTVNAIFSAIADKRKTTIEDVRDTFLRLRWVNTYFSIFFGFALWDITMFAPITIGKISVDVAEYYRLRRRKYVRAVIGMAEAKFRAKFEDAKDINDRTLRCYGFLMYMEVEHFANTKKIARKFRGDELRKVFNHYVMRDLVLKTNQDDKRDSENDKDGDNADDAAEVKVVTTPTGLLSDATQPFISVYEWHLEATSGGDDVTEQLSARILELTPQFAKHAIAEKVQKRFDKLVAALEKKLPSDRKSLQTLFMTQVEANDGGTGALLRVVADNVKQRSTARRAGVGGGGGKTKSYDFFRQGRRGFERRTRARTH
jgi:hypothetical protein